MALLVPALGLVWLAQSDIRHALAFREENSRLLELAEFAVVSSAMVHELQKERGMSAGYLGSKGGSFGPQIRDHYAITDARIAELQQLLNAFDSESFGAEFSSKLATGVADLKQIAEIRERVQTLEIPLGDALGYYTVINSEFLGLIEFLPRLSSVGEFGIGGSAYVAFLQSKERAGIERAVLSNTFANDRFGPGLYDRFRTLVTTQNVYLDVFRSTATLAQRLAFDQLMDNDAVRETERMRSVALARSASGGFETSSTYWFEQQTLKINLLKQMEDQLSADLRALAQTGLQRAETTVTATSVTALLPLILAVVLGVALIVSTMRQLGADPSRLEYFVNEIANDNLSVEMSTGAAETGVFASARVMQRRLRERIESDRLLLAENGRVRQALMNVSGYVLIAGPDGKVIFVNDALREFVDQIGAYVETDTAVSFEGSLEGVDLEQLHQSPSESLANISSETEARITFGPHTIDYVANPVYADNGDRVGTVVEWRDRTADLEEARQVEITLAENGRIREALVNVDGMVMIAGRENQIVFANTAMMDFLDRIESSIAQRVSGFFAASVLGADASFMHREVSHGAAFDASSNSAQHGRLEFGSHTIDYASNPVFSDSGERMGTVFEWRDQTEALAEEVVVKATLEENGRVREALNSAAANVMIAGPDHKIVYANHAMRAFFDSARDEIMKATGEGNVPALEGTHVAILHRESDPQVFESLSERYQSQVMFETITVDYIANPVFGDDGDRIGTVFEWVDRTAELAVEEEVQGVVTAALAGDLSRRIALGDKTGFFVTLSENVNQLVGIAQFVLDDTMRVFAAVAKGNLTETIDREYVGAFDQLKSDANTTIAQLTEVVGRIQKSAGWVRSAAEEISQGNVDLARRTESQAASLQETAASIEEMTGAVSTNASNAQEAEALALTAREHAERGGTVVKQAINAMKDISNSSREVTAIIGVIDEIAFQTNLLALNAAVEAARAGEQGRGFAVVANEVRNLAGRSGSAARQIKELIEASTSRVDVGSQLVDETGKTLEEIVRGVDQVSDMVGKIASANRKQSTGIQEINGAVTQIDELTQQNAALVEEAAQGSQALTEQADGLNQLMRFFNTETETHASVKHSVPARGNNAHRAA